MAHSRLIAAAAVLLAATAARAHDFSITDTVVLLKSNGVYQIDLTIDLDALALNIPPKLSTPERIADLATTDAAEKSALLATLRDTLSKRFRIRFDGRTVAPNITFPDYGSPPLLPTAAPTVFGITARLTGPIPPDAKEFSFGATRDAGVIYLTILDQGYAAGVKQVLSDGGDSPPFPLDRPPSTSADGRPQSRIEIALRYLVLGFEHILPLGLDHILFVLGLFLLSPRLKPLLWQVSAFTLAHTITLALSVCGVVQLPSRIVEPLIALSIAYVGVENVFTSELKPWRPLLVFGFGLLHGLGFAGVLRDLGLPRGEFATSLISFNVGVELGQLTVIAGAMLTIGWFRRRAWYRSAIVIPMSAGIALVGLYWAVQRAMAGA